MRKGEKKTERKEKNKDMVPLYSIQCKKEKKRKREKEKKRKREKEN